MVWKERKQIITERWGKGYGLTASGGRAKGAGSHLQAEACEKSAAEAEFGEWELCCDSHCSTELAVGPHSSSLFLVLRQEPGQGPALQSHFSGRNGDGFSLGMSQRPG